MRWWLVAMVLIACTDGTVRRPDPGDDTADSVDTGSPEQPTWDPAIDAVFPRSDGKAFFFRGAEYIRYDLAADEADQGYPRATANWWAGVGDQPLDAAFDNGDGTAWLFRGDQALRYDWAADAVASAQPLSDAFPGVWSDGVDAAARVGDVLLFRDGDLTRLRDGAVVDGYPRPIEQEWPAAGPGPVDAALPLGDRLYLFRGVDYLRIELATGTVHDVYPRPRTFWWPGLWDEHEGSGHPGDLLPPDVAAQLWVRPDDDEIAARRARVALSAAGGGYVDLTPEYPAYVASIEDRLGVWGCGLLERSDAEVYRFRCATDTSGPVRLDIEPVHVGWIDWSHAAYHSAQVSQGDFMADLGTPLSIFGADGGQFRVVAVNANSATGSISAGLNVRVGFDVDGVAHEIGFSHLNTAVPGYVLDAWQSGTPLSCGTAFGFIGATGNLWTGTPPAEDGPYAGSGAGLPVPHSHLWFVGEADDHESISFRSRRAIDYSGTYPFGGG